MKKGKWQIPLKGGDEYDAISGWRKVIGFRPGERAAAKRQYQRRLRKHGKSMMTQAMNEFYREWAARLCPSSQSS